MLIVITGPDGSGKSTVCRALSHLLEYFYGQDNIAVVSAWDIAPQLFSSRIKARDHLNSLEGPSRSLLILYGIRHALDLALKSSPKIILFDSYWYKYVASEIGRGESKEWLYNAVKIFPRPDWVFHLDISPQDAALRKKVIRDYECGITSGKVSIEKFVCFQSKLLSIWKEIEVRTGPWKHISGQLALNEIVDQILNACKVDNLHYEEITG